MPRKINCSIDVKKINKSKLFNGKNGAVYLNFTLIETPNGKYGNNWMIVEDKKKDEQGNATILGNGKNHGWGDGGGSSSSNSNPKPAPSVSDIGF